MNAHASRNQWTENQTQALLAYRQAGLSAEAIAAEMRMTKSQVFGRLYRIDNPPPKKARENAWTMQQREIVRRGALFKADIDDVCELLAKAGRPMQPKAIQDSRPYREGQAQARAVEERMSHNAHDRQRLADNRAAREQTQERIQKAGTYRCPHHPNDRINLPVVKGYTPEGRAHG